MYAMQRFTTYTGITTNCRKRMNNHISDIHTGRTTNIFDRHVHECCQKNNYFEEPYFRMYAFMEVSDEKLLLTYESYFHRLKFDTMNWNHSITSLFLIYLFSPFHAFTALLIIRHHLNSFTSNKNFSVIFSYYMHPDEYRKRLMWYIF